MQTSVEIEIANGIYPCAIGLQGVREIELACGGKNNDGIGVIAARVMFGTEIDWDSMSGDAVGAEPARYLTNPLQAAYRMQDLLEFVRQSLIGAAAIGLKPTIDGVPATHGCTASRANELIQNYLVPPHCDLETLRKYATFIAGNLVVGYNPPEKKSPSPEPVIKKAPARRKTATSPASPTA